MLTKRTYIAHALVAASLGLPAGALAGDSTGGSGSAGATVGISDAKPLAISRISPPVGHFHRTIRAVKRQIAVKRRAALRRERRQAFATLPAGVSMATLEAIAGCESGGDPTIVSADGSYRGKYQFSFETWAAVGGSGDPAAAPEREQDYRAALLYAQSGSNPWPICG